MISKERYKNLKEYIKKYSEKDTPETTKKIVEIKNEIKISPPTRRSYETNNIWLTRDSEYWQWIRVKHWFNEFNDEKLENNINLKQKLKNLGVK